METSETVTDVHRNARSWRAINVSSPEDLVPGHAEMEFWMLESNATIEISSLEMDVLLLVD